MTITKMVVERILNFKDELQKGKQKKHRWISGVFLLKRNYSSAVFFASFLSCNHSIKAPVNQ